MENPLADILEMQNHTFRRRLSFESKCGWFVAMRLGVDPKTVALASELSIQSAIYLRRAGDRVGGQVRYPDIAREYEALGHEAFVHKYLTPGIRDQVRAATETLMVQAKRGLNGLGYSPRANRMCHRYEWPKTTSGKHLIFCIELHETRGGYFWRDLKPFPYQPEIPEKEVDFTPACAINGDPTRGPERGPDALGFARSEDAYRYVKSIYDPKEDR